MPWIPGDLIINPAANQVLVSRRFSTPGPVYVTVCISAQVPLQCFFQLVNAAGDTVKQQLPLYLSTSFLSTGRLGPLNVDINETLRVINRNAAPEVSNEEASASLFIEP